MSQRREKRVLFVSYLFPPAGGVGTQRVTKFVKFLPEFGWNSSVLTVSNPSVPLIDETLTRDIPPNTVIRRARTYEPDYQVKQAVAAKDQPGRRASWLKRLGKSLVKRAANFVLQPDAQILWHPQALREGKKLLAELRHDVIIATGPPFSSLLLGAKLARQSGLPLILDYRDEWDISNAYWENKGQGTLSNLIQTWQQARAVRTAKVLLATTPSSSASIAKFAAESESDARSAFIYNGFDSDDYRHAHAPTTNAARPAKFRLAFIGTLWNLNSIQPVVEALLKLSQDTPRLAGEIELLLAGRRMPDQEKQLDRLAGSPVEVTRLPFVSHQEAIDLMGSAHALLMLNSDLPQTQRIINAKTFEYMAARRPMFVVAPRGDVWDVVRDLPGTVLCEPKDVGQIAAKLALLVEEHRCGVNHNDDHWDIARFERRALAGELAELLEQTLAKRAAERSAVSSQRSANSRQRMSGELRDES